MNEIQIVTMDKHLKAMSVAFRWQLKYLMAKYKSTQ
jgi:hypothetical protein